MSNTVKDITDFRRALGQFPTGVTVITALADSGEPVGMTASSFNTVSLDPPLLLWSVDRDGQSASTFIEAKHFAVNVLSESQIELSNRFAATAEDRFAGLPWRKGVGGSPLLESCAAVFECKTWNVYEGGDHMIIVGEVLNYEYDALSSPLAFSQGNYAQITS